MATITMICIGCGKDISDAKGKCTPCKAITPDKHA